MTDVRRLRPKHESLAAIFSVASRLQASANAQIAGSDSDREDDNRAAAPTNQTPISSEETPPGATYRCNSQVIPFARSFDVEPIAVPVNDAARIESALAPVWREPGGGLIVMPDAFTIVLPRAIVALAAQHHFPAIYPYRDEVVDGGLMSYGVDTVDLFRRAASYVDRLLKGERASDLAVQAPVKFNLVLNLKTAEALGLEVPPTLLARADKVIE
jgi:hypothetical protein